MTEGHSRANAEAPGTRNPIPSRGGRSASARSCGRTAHRRSAPKIRGSGFQTPAVAVSDCLTGATVRFDGGHKHSSLPHERFEGLFEFRGFCPELSIGLGVPRDPIQLVGDPAAPRARGVKDPGLDVTDRLHAYAEAVAPTLDDVSGFIFMKNSPSCGLERVKLYARPGIAPTHVSGFIFMKNSPSCGLVRVKVYARPGAAPSANGRGIFAAGIVRARPDLPVADCARLFDPVLCENFVTRTFAYAHWRRVEAAGVTAARLIAFHSACKYLLMAHSVRHYQAAGRLLADVSGDLDDLEDRYVGMLMAGLARPARLGGHANVLQHLQGYVKKELDAVTRQELAEAIHAYRRGEVPLLAPLTLLKHHLRRFPDQYALDQIYLNPHPPSAGLRRSL